VSRPLLILDLDETLVYATKQPLDRTPDFDVGPFVVYRRPQLREFIESVALSYELAVWTSAGRDYASGIVADVFCDHELRFFWSAERCTQRTNLETYERYTVKDLRKVARQGYPLEQMLMVDDSPEKLERTYGNHIWIPPFEGDLSDSELPVLARYLSSISHHPNFRAIEKRHWRQKT
jgi:carboxy-terminal domain RNA polymerase II polypeptide A small phosphatase